MASLTPKTMTMIGSTFSKPAHAKSRPKYFHGSSGCLKNHILLENIMFNEVDKNSSPLVNHPIAHSTKCHNKAFSFAKQFVYNESPKIAYSLGKNRAHFMQQPDIYQKSFTVIDEDLDAAQHMNNVRYLFRLQEAATEHWQFLADKSLQDRYLWVARRHEIDYLAPAFLGQNLLIETFIQSCQASLSHRVYRITHRDSQKCLVQANSQWCLLRRDSMKPCKIPQEIILLFQGASR